MRLASLEDARQAGRPENKPERKRFVALERELLGSESLYVPELGPDVNKYLRGRSPFYEEMEHSLFLASNGRDVARCAAMVNRVQWGGVPRLWRSDRCL